MKINRRRFIAATLIPALSGSLMARAAFGQMVPAWPDAATDLTGTLQAAIDGARDTGHLALPAGRFSTRGLRLPSGFMLTGVPGATQLVHLGSAPLLGAEGEANIVLAGLSIDGSGAGGEVWHGGLVHFADCENVTIRDCVVSNTALNGITLMKSSGRVENCRVSGSDYTGLFVYDAAGVSIEGNTIAECGNGGIRVWRGEAGADGTIISGNRISGIDWADGGNGQNGNGINIFRADEVIVSGNHISDCAFSAVRLNATNNTHITGNTCLASGEVAIFSEFSFTGSVIANNIIDGAAAGISMTNFNDGGRLAVCTGNIVRNLYEGSETNPDLDTPYGIAAEADAIISDNVIENVPGTGISAGWGPYLRDVTISGNLVRDVDVGIVVSVAEGAGAASITGNTIIGARQHEMVGSAWWDVISSDLAGEAERFPQIVVEGNRVS
ncbi:TIGR03808 family TAT-translocated repetitive protein [Pelagibacterium flavum]|uniref:TIGR03808 family TAT-translocated repetitive protein n=1 Tax=Pelagibacterium flavum TaxID=2984530 RepID=A0ABY6ILD7_9HYPH|nr:TIGR03808 family TAT-translocated repetitive protein [Pelagibacterium sp. YIM 151497]MAN76397.1 TIGR03808 family TAT-translocated repetitive protein [Hyphomicrobiales bacterium]UYQ71410.1 TIGR03808 family TAT-translocated repetitive protein [Pelagibacterium sp. YIM 151497]|tara:strand:+ start:19249 stop:20571 length:1323 start_codon:yes stop_codon:yes gene_type:complete